MIGDLSQEKLGCADQIAELKGKIDHFFHLAAIYDMTADAESQRVANVEGTREAVKLAEALEAEALPHGELDRRGRPLQGHLHRGHVRGGRGGRQPPLLPDQARVRGGRARGVRRAVAGSTGRGSSSATPRPARWTRSTGPTTSSSCCSARATSCRSGSRRSASRARDQHRPGGLRRQGDGPHRAPGRARRQGLPPHRPEPADRRAEVINTFAKAAHAPEAAMRIDSEDARLHPQADAHGPADAAAGEADHRPGAGRPRHPALGARLHQLPDRLRLDEHAGGAGGTGDLGARRCRATPTGSGTTGSATSIPTCSRTARCPARSAARW